MEESHEMKIEAAYSRISDGHVPPGGGSPAAERGVLPGHPDFGRAHWLCSQGQGQNRLEEEESVGGGTLVGWKLICLQTPPQIGMNSLCQLVVDGEKLGF